MPANSGIGRSLPIPAQVNAGDIFVRQTAPRNSIMMYDGLAWRDMNASNVYNVMSYGATFDGVTDDTAAIQAALNAARTSGVPSVVLMPPGTAKISKRAHPNYGGHFAALVVGSLTSLVGSGIGSTTLRLQNSEPNDDQNGTGLIMNYNVAVFTDTEISLSDFTLDGNAANQTNFNNGIHLLRASRSRVSRVKVTNIRGTTNGGTTETFHFEIGLCSDVVLDMCEAIATAAHTATGFSADNSTNVRWAGCLAAGMGHGHGFTHNACDHMSLVGCDSYLNGTYGFNTEESIRVAYHACRAGGVAGQAAGGIQEGAYTANQVLLNTSNGFTCSGTTDVDYHGCQSDHNGGHGFAFSKGVASVRRAAVVGGQATNNTGSGFYIDSDSSSGNVVLDPTIFTSGNGTAITYDGTNTCGPRTYVAGVTLGASTATYLNPFPFDVFVRISGTNISAMTLAGGNLLPLATGSNFILPAGASFTITYSSSTPAMQVWAL